jgi:hypothetical protein
VPTCPPMYVDAPAVTPYLYGLFSVAQMPVDADEHWQCGVEYEPQACGPAKTWADPCDDDPLNPQAPKAADEGVALVTGSPFVVYAGFNCHLVGRSEADVQARAAQALALGEQRAVEQAYWTGEAGNYPLLADPAAVVLGGGAVSPIAALGALEGYLGSNYGGIGVIHTPRAVVAWLSREGVLSRDRDRLVTDLGTWVAAGGGYAVNTGPDGTPAAAGTAWMYATGAVVVRRSPVWLNPDSVAQALDRTSNLVHLLAERTYVITHECILAAVLTTIA